MSGSGGVFERLKARGEEVLNQVSQELMASPHFLKAVQSAMRGKEKLDQAAGRALKQMNIPTRSEFKRALARIEALEAQLGARKADEPKAGKKPAAKPGPRRRKASGPATTE